MDNLLVNSSISLLIGTTEFGDNKDDILSHTKSMLWLPLIEEDEVNFCSRIFQKHQV